MFKSEYRENETFERYCQSNFQTGTHFISGKKFLSIKLKLSEYLREFSVIFGYDTK